MIRLARRTLTVAALFLTLALASPSRADDSLPGGGPPTPLLRDAVSATGEVHHSSVAIQADGIAFLSPAYVVQIITLQARLHFISAPLLLAVASCESNFRWNAVGDHGHSVGPFQINDFGLAREFFRRGNTDRMNVWQASNFAAEMVVEGRVSAWTCSSARYLARFWWPSSPS